MKTKIKYIFFVVDIIIILIIWTILSFTSEVMRNYILPPPHIVFFNAYELLIDGTLLNHIIASLRRTGIGFCIALCTAVPLGVLLGSQKAIYKLFDPIIEIIRPISPIAWIPLSILWFGIGELSKIFIIWLLSFFFIFLNTINGVWNIDKKIIDAARTLGASKVFIFFKVMLPAALPDIITGARLGLGVSIGGVLIAEMVAANSGIGFMMERARVILDPSTVITGLVTIGIIGYTINSLFGFLQKHLKHFKSLGK